MDAVIYLSDMCESPDALSGASMAELARYFEKSSTFTDASCLGKVRNAYPFDLFTLVQAYHLHEAHAEDDFFRYVLAMALWVEDLENRHFSLGRNPRKSEFCCFLFFL
jgi:hypothetical protein